VLRAPLAVVLVLVAALATACGGDEPVRPVAAPAGVRVSVLQYRSDYTIRQLEIKVTNGGPAPITVVAARLTSPALAATTTWHSRDRSDEALIKPGSATDLPARLPDVLCPSPGRTVGTGASVTLDLRGPDGTVSRTRALPAADPYATVAGVDEQDCRRRAALAIATVGLGPLRVTTERGALVGRLDLTLTPTGHPGTLSVDSIGSTTLLGPPTGAAWPVHRTVTAGAGAQRVVLTLRPARCDPHAIAEDKLGTVLPLTVRVDDGPTGEVDLAADQGLRARIQHFVHDACTG
jgi:hypothetical protein